MSEQNWRAYEAYLQVRATSGACLSRRQRRDPLSLRILAIIDSVLRNHQHRESLQLMQNMALLLSQR